MGGNRELFQSGGHLGFRTRVAVCLGKEMPGPFSASGGKNNSRSGEAAFCWVLEARVGPLASVECTSGEIASDRLCCGSQRWSRKSCPGDHVCIHASGRASRLWVLSVARNVASFGAFAFATTHNFWLRQLRMDSAKARSAVGSSILCCSSARLHPLAKVSSCLQEYPVAWLTAQCKCLRRILVCVCVNQRFVFPGTMRS